MWEVLGANHWWTTAWLATFLAAAGGALVGGGISVCVGWLAARRKMRVEILRDRLPALRAKLDATHDVLAGAPELDALFRAAIVSSPRDAARVGEIAAPVRVVHEANRIYGSMADLDNTHPDRIEAGRALETAQGDGAADITGAILRYEAWLKWRFLPWWRRPFRWSSLRAFQTVWGPARSR